VWSYWELGHALVCRLRHFHTDQIDRKEGYIPHKPDNKLCTIQLWHQVMSHITLATNSVHLYIHTLWQGLIRLHYFYFPKWEIKLFVFVLSSCVGCGMGFLQHLLNKFCQFESKDILELDSRGNNVLHTVGLTRCGDKQKR